MSVKEFEAINQQFIETKKALIERERILSVMASVDEDLLIEQRKLPQLTTKKKYELYDVHALEETTLKSVFYALLRSRKKQLDKEIEEYLEAKLAVERCEIRIASLASYLAELEIQLIDLAECDETLAALHQAQIQLVSQLSTPEADQVAAIAQSLPVLQVKHQEYLEAYEIGQQVFSGIDNLIDILLKGKGYGGTWNRHNPINNAIELSLAIQPVLDKFQQELHDISLHFWYPPEMQTPKHLNAPISIFGINFSDSVDQSRIHKWVTHLQQLKKRINLKMEMIENELASLRARIEKQEKEKQSLMAQLWDQSSFVHDL